MGQCLNHCADMGTIDLRHPWTGVGFTDRQFVCGFKNTHHMMAFSWLERPLNGQRFQFEVLFAYIGSFYRAFILVFLENPVW